MFMKSTEEWLRDALQRLVESLDDATISFEDCSGDSTEAALEFDEAYLDACEALGMELADRTRQESLGRSGIRRPGPGASSSASPQPQSSGVLPG
jgi:hypothetical protein